MKDGLYHWETGLPCCPSKFELGMLKILYSEHAKEAAKDDRYGLIKLPECFDSNTAEVIEVEVKRGKIDKVVYRIPYNPKNDLVIVLGCNGVARTVWLNRKDDSHITLDVSKYVRGTFY